MAISAARDAARVAQSLAQAGTESHKHDIGYWVERGKRLDFASGRRVQAAGSFEGDRRVVQKTSKWDRLGQFVTICPKTCFVPPWAMPK